MHLRTFIAIELPPQIKEYLSSIQQRLSLSGADVKWVATKNIHLTLKFLGEREEKTIEKVKQVVEDVAKEKRLFSVGIAGAGAFPKPECPRVIWVGIGEGDKEIREIAQALEERICRLGIPKEDRQFNSHITIGRVKSAFGCNKLVAELNKLENPVSGEGLNFPADSIVLFKSTLSAQGPIYEILKKANLKTD